MKKVMAILGLISVIIPFHLIGYPIHASFNGVDYPYLVPTPTGFPSERFNQESAEDWRFEQEFSDINGNSIVANAQILSTPLRGVIGDEWADVIIGQPDFTQITPDEVVGNHLFNPGGILIDRTTIPNRLYVYDAGNSRILGFASLGECSAGTNIGNSCTTNSDCPGSYCQIQADKNPDIILGQPEPWLSGCNHDSGMQNYPLKPQASAATLCGMNPDSISILEAGAMITMDTDENGNLYISDLYNHRVLRYDNPFLNDTIADHVWGQENFSNGECNLGLGYFSPTNKSLCLAPLPGFGNLKTGVDIDSNNNLWIADTQNSRVLRFKYNSETGVPDHDPDLVLGQTNFSSRTPGNLLDQMDNPASVRVSDDGTVFVADSVNGDGLNGRVLVFTPPITNGMAAINALTFGMAEPTGLELDLDGNLWVNDCENQRLLNIDNQSLVMEIGEIPTRAWGGLGIDRDGNIYITGWDPQQIMKYSAPSYEWMDTFLPAYENGSVNQLGSHGMMDSLGLEVTPGQMIVSDLTRLLYWNNPIGLSTYQAADGVVGQPNFYTRPKWGARFGRLRADNHDRIWTVRGHLWEVPKILAYQLPLTTGEAPIIEISSPLPLLGGGSFTWTTSLLLSGIAYQPECDCLWLSDTDYNRVFRIRNVSSSTRVVDIVLGQQDINGIHCNQGRDPDDGYAHPLNPTQNSLCHPGGLELDNWGNLFVSDNNLEVAGNGRLLVFDTNSIPTNPFTAIFGIPADRVIGRNGDFTESECIYGVPMCSPWEPAFNSTGQMAIGFNGYLGTRFTHIYQDLFTDPSLMAPLGDFYSHPISIRYDHFDNLFVLDLTRHRVLIYWNTELENVFLPLIKK